LKFSLDLYGFCKFILELVNCYNSSRMSPETRDRILLSSAKANLEKMAYFGVTEEQRTSQYLFEATFNLRFNTILGQFNNTHSEDAAESLTKETLNRIRNLNSLDHELYTFALQLMEKRFLTMQGTVLFILKYILLSSINTFIHPFQSSFHP